MSMSGWGVVIEQLTHETDDQRRDRRQWQQRRQAKREAAAKRASQANPDARPTTWGYLRQTATRGLRDA